MAERDRTPNYYLVKPKYDETADIQDINDNMDIIDVSLKGVSDRTGAVEGRFSSEKLKIANGGTGLNASPSMLANLGSTTADNVLKASPRPGITGTLPVSHGGTGATGASGARTNLGLGTAATRDAANNLTTTASGYVLDARQGKALNDKIERINMYFGSVTKTSSAYGNIDLDIDSSGNKVVSAWCSDVGGTIVLPYVASGDWWVDCRSDLDFNKKANTRMTINFYYMKI